MNGMYNNGVSRLVLPAEIADGDLVFRSRCGLIASGQTHLEVVQQCGRRGYAGKEFTEAATGRQILQYFCEGGWHSDTAGRKTHF